MDSPSASSSAPRRHLKRLSLSVTPRDRGESLYALGRESPVGQAPITPDRFPSSQYAAVAELHPTSSPSPSTSTYSPSPLARSIGPGSGRRQRPLSLYATSPARSPASEGPASSATIHEEDEDGNAADANSDTVTSPTASRNGLRSSLDNGSLGRRTSLLSRSHSRKQSSISYARSPNNSAPSTPRSSIAHVNENANPDASAADNSIPRNDNGSNAGTPSDLPQSPAASLHSSSSHSNNQTSDYFSQGTPSGKAESTEMRSAGSAGSMNELNVGIGAKSADLLVFIAKKERKCLDLREELKKHEEELAILKKKWEAIIQRDMMASRAESASSSNTSASNISPTATFISPATSAPATSAGGLFSSLTSSLTASTSSTSSLTASPSPKPTSNRRLLTSRHSISVSPSAGRSPNLSASSLFGTPEHGQGQQDQYSPESVKTASPGDGSQEAYDVSKMAKSWFGGMMKSASVVLDTLAPPSPNTSTIDLDTVQEEEEPEEGGTDLDKDTARTSVSHPQYAVRKSHPVPHARHASTATNGSLTGSSSVGSSSPHSSYAGEDEEGRFSSSTSVSSMGSTRPSIETLDFDTGKVRKERNGESDDITPIATPVLPTQETPRPQGDSEDLWGLTGFEEPAARETREKLEKERIDEVHTSPPRRREMSSSTPASLSSSSGMTRQGSGGHGRRKSTAFELGGTWGSMVGKKWGEWASSETFKNSKRATMNFVDTFEKTLTDAITVDASTSPQNNERIDGTLINGEYITSSNWSPQEGQSLPSGIGSAGMGWSSFMRPSGTGSSSSSQAKRSPSMQQSHQTDDWMNGDIGEVGMSPPLTADNKLGTTFSSAHHSGVFPDPISPTGPKSSPSSSSTTAQARLQASRAKHSKRMSLPGNFVTPISSSSRGQSHSNQAKASPNRSFGLGLDNVSEAEEKENEEDGWGW